MPEKKDNPKEKTQRERFIETAREIEADESAESFERVFEKIVTPKGSLPRRNEKPPSS